MDKNVLVNLVLDQIQKDIDAGEWESLAGLLENLDEIILQSYLPKEVEDDGQPDEYTEWMDYDPDC